MSGQHRGRFAGHRLSFGDSGFLIGGGRGAGGAWGDDMVSSASSEAVFEGGGAEGPDRFCIFFRGKGGSVFGSSSSSEDKMIGVVNVCVGCCTRAGVDCWFAFMPLLLDLSLVFVARPAAKVL